MNISLWMTRSIYEPQKRNRTVMLGMQQKKAAFHYQIGV